MEKSVILYFGSFNPIHKGHIAVADSTLNAISADELWFIVSPQNPFKEGRELASQQHRLEMAQIAMHNSQNRDKMMVSDVEFALPLPSRTINTLRHLNTQYQYSFGILIGSDNVADFDKWAEYKQILDNYKVFVYPRDGYNLQNSKLTQYFTFIDNVEKFPESATHIRETKDINAWLDPEVVSYIKEHNLYGM